MGITTDCKLDVLGNVDLDHGRLVVHKLLDGDDDLVDVFSVNQLASLEPLHHVVNEFLCHAISKSHTVIILLNDHGVQVKIGGSGGLITNFDGSKKGELTDNPFAFLQFQTSILVVGVKLDTFFEVIDGFFRSEDGGFGKTSSEISLE